MKNDRNGEQSSQKKFRLVFQLISDQLSRNLVKIS